MFLSACTSKNDNEQAEKNVTVKVLWEENEKEIKLITREKYLGKALKNEKLIEGEEGQYGLYIKSVIGIKADEAKEQWWCITKGDESVMTGVDMIEIEDGDLFKFTLKEGY